MKVSFIGSGNVATFFAKQLFQNGVSIHQIFSPTLAHAQQLSNIVNANGIGEWRDIDDTADVYIIAIKDDAFQLINTCPIFHNKIIIHCSGTKSIHKFEKITQNRGIIWPVYSIRKTDLPTAATIPLVIDYSNDIVAPIVQQLAANISENITILNEQQRRYLHLNAVFVNNFPNHLFAIAEQICKEQEVPYDILVPIIQQSFQDIASGNFLKKQTGPAIRNDFTTIDKHIQMLQPHPSWQQLYEDITNSIIRDNKLL